MQSQFQFYGEEFTGLFNGLIKGKLIEVSYESSKNGYSIFDVERIELSKIFFGSENQYRIFSHDDVNDDVGSEPQKEFNSGGVIIFIP
jgi:hypothetical protein